MPEARGRIGGLLIDLDGTVYQGSAPIPGAVEAIRRLERAEVPFLFTTNTSRKSRAAVVEGLSALGIPVDPGRVLTAPVAAARWLEKEGIRRILPLLPASTHEDLDAFDLVHPEDDPVTALERTEAVVVGDLGRDFTFEVLNRAFLALRAGARLVAVHRNRWWLPDAGPVLDAGPFVVALEYAAGVEACLVGKPAPAFFDLAADMLGVRRDGLAVVGDDPESDVAGAREAGLIAIQVETGKFDSGRAAGARVEERPHHRIRSIAGLSDLLGL